MTVSQPASALLAFGTAVPAHRVDQMAVGRWVADGLPPRPAFARWIDRLYATSGIETRYSCLPDAGYPPHESRFNPGSADPPTTLERMRIYEREAVAVGTAAAREALAEAQEREPLDDVVASVTHLLVVSCTGFFAPGLDLALVNNLGLQPTVARTMIGFMGCAAAFNGLRMADQIVRGQPEARVLVVCVELCSLHIQPGDDRTNLVVGSLFADGAAACLVGAPDLAQGDVFAIQGFHTSVYPETTDEMVWQIGNHGFILNLSPRIPERLGEVVPTMLHTLFGDVRPQFWAVHPGGRGIVDRVEAVMNLATDDVAATRHILRNYGNLSSPTILFVLKELRERMRQQPGELCDGVAMAFGPGLVAEMARLVYLPTTVAHSENDVVGAAYAWVA